jgi:hypothetical protein
VANGATGVSCVALASGARNSDVVNGLRSVVRGKPGDCNEVADENVRIKSSLTVS